MIAQDDISGYVWLDKIAKSNEGGLILRRGKGHISHKITSDCYATPIMLRQGMREGSLVNVSAMYRFATKDERRFLLMRVDDPEDITPGKWKLPGHLLASGMRPFNSLIDLLNEKMVYVGCNWEDSVIQETGQKFFMDGAPPFFANHTYNNQTLELIYPVEHSVESFEHLSIIDSLCPNTRYRLFTLIEVLKLMDNQQLNKSTNDVFCSAIANSRPKTDA